MKRAERSKYVSIILGFGMLAVSTVAYAWDWDFQKDPAWFGQLNQHSIVDPFGGIYACAPTAAVNSFDYLQFRYPGVYDTSLVPDYNGNGITHNDPVDLGILAHTLESSLYMNTIINQGTFWGDFVWGKYDYLEQVAPGKTTYEAQDAFNWSVSGANVGKPRPAWDAPIKPTADFLYNELTQCEDIELFIMPLTTGEGHAVTLTSWQWDLTSQSGVMDYIDPWIGAWSSANVWLDGSGRLETSYLTGQESWIEGAVAESVPEPLSIVMLGCLGAGMAVARKLRRKKA